MKSKNVIVITLLLLLVGCASRGVLIHPEWEQTSLSQIAIVGFLPYEKPAFLMKKKEKEAIKPDIWWYDEFNDSLSQKLISQFPEYNFFSFSQTINKMKELGKLNLLDSLRNEVNKNIQRPPGFKLWIDHNGISKGLIREICNTLYVDALFIGAEKIEPLSIVTGGLLLKTQTLSVQLLSGAHLIDKNEVELWRFSQRFKTVQNQQMKVQLIGKTFNPYLLSIANGPNLVKQSLDFYPLVFPHKGKYNPSELPPTENIPLVKYDKDYLKIFLPKKATIKTLNSSGMEVFDGSPSAMKFKWDYVFDGNKVDGGNYQLVVKYIGKGEESFALKNLNMENW